MKPYHIIMINEKQAKLYCGEDLSAIENCAAASLVFMAHAEHRRLHYKSNPLSEALKGRRLPEERRRKPSELKLGEKHPNFGKRLSDETKRKISEARKEYWRKQKESQS